MELHKNQVTNGSDISPERREGFNGPLALVILLSALVAAAIAMGLAIAISN